MKTIHVAVIGLGYWGPNLVRNFLKIPGVKIKAVCDVSPKQIQNFKKEYQDIYVTTHYEEILNDPEISLVAIATPLKSHFILSKQALLSGKHVLIEKPMTETSKEAKELIRIAERMKKILMVGHTFVYTPAVQKIKKIISQKTFGKFLYYDSTRINLGRLQADTNVIWDLAPHDLAILMYLFSENPIRVQAIGSSHISKNNLEIAHIFLTYANNITAHIHVSWLSPVKIRNILIGGSNQMIHYNDIEPSEKIKIYNKSVILNTEEITPFAPAYRSGNVLIPAIEQKEGLFRELEHLITCIKTNTQPITNAYHGLKVIKLLEALDKSIFKSSQVTLNEKNK
jgi:predicted dehydrogenase